MRARSERVVTLQDEAGRAVLKVNARIEVQVVPVTGARAGELQQPLREDAKPFRVRLDESLAG